MRVRGHQREILPIPMKMPSPMPASPRETLMRKSDLTMIFPSEK